jgi:hypothetical protein
MAGGSGLESAYPVWVMSEYRLSCNLPMFFQRLLGGKPSLNGLDKKAKGRKKEE